MFNFFKSKEKNDKELFIKRLENYGYVMGEYSQYALSTDKVNGLYLCFTHFGFDVTEISPKTLICSWEDINSLYGILDLGKEGDLHALFTFYVRQPNKKHYAYCEYSTMLNSAHTLLKNNHDLTVMFEKKYTDSQLEFLVRCILKDIEYKPYIDVILPEKQSGLYYELACELANWRIIPALFKDNHNLKYTKWFLETKNDKVNFTNEDLLEIKNFNNDQLAEISFGLRSNVNVKCYYNPGICDDIMRSVRKKLEKKYIDNLVDQCGGE